MELEPFDWNIVIVGRWNSSILTPGRIAKKVFGLDTGAPLSVEVPLDGVSPYRVRDPQEDITIVTEYNRLIIQLVNMDYDKLKKGLDVGVKILDWLPETPLSAAGFNVRYKTEEHNQELLDLFESSVDSNLGEIEGFTISERTFARSLDYKEGKLRLALTYNNGITFLLNFHRGSNNIDDLKGWLRMPKEEIEKVVTDIINVFEN